LSAIPNDVKRYSDEIAEAIERHIEHIAASLRGAIQTSPWLPESIKQAPPPPPRYIPQVPLGYLEHAQDWISRHRAVTAAVLAFVGTGTFILWRRQRSYHKKRRARRAENGSRSEVIVLAGSPHSPLTRSLSLDLERRGFIIYIPISTLSEEQLVRSESRADIRPLQLDIASPTSTATTLSKLTTYLTTPHRTHSSTTSHTLHLASLILLSPPPHTHPTGPLKHLSAKAWHETLTAHLLAPLTTLHAFLPLLTTQNSSLLFLTPSILPSLCPANHGPESVLAGATDAYIRTLRQEISTPLHGVNVVQLQLGALDYGSAPGGRHQLQVMRNAREAREGGGGGVKGSSMREVQNAVFDAVVGGRGGTVYVGRGSYAYALLGKWIPDGVMGWMLGMRERDAGEFEGGGSEEWEKVERGVGV
ncbi:hypothetical protein MMC12_002759, partial [Toensbergia leucococca]|nr:hypothetical protein [Toensbergia leucococca]